MPEIAETLDALIAQFRLDPESRDGPEIARLAAALRDSADAEIGPPTIPPGPIPVDGFTLTAVAIYLMGARDRIGASGEPDVHEWRELRLVGHALAEHYGDHPPIH